MRNGEPVSAGGCATLPSTVQSTATLIAPLDGFPEAVVRLVVIGKPQPAGSKRAFAIRRDGVPTGKIVVADANKHAKGWKQEVAGVAAAAMGDEAMLLGPVAVTMTFYVARPKGHFGSGRNASLLKASAPPFPIVKPDALKLARGTEDACTGIVWRDDAQVVDLEVRKRYGLPERCEIAVRVACGSGL